MLPPNGLPFSCRKRMAKPVKIQTISCAKRSAATACSALMSSSFGLFSHVLTSPAKYHTPTTGIRLEPRAVYQTGVRGLFDQDYLSTISDGFL
jgi:hypothetical protein